MFKGIYGPNNKVFLKLESGNWAFLTGCPKKKGTKGRVGLQNWMNFWKNSKRPLTPPSFLEKYIANFS